MPSNEEFVRFLAAWALVHETADEGWKAAVERGQTGVSDSMGLGSDAFVDGLSAMVSEEKERLKQELASGRMSTPGSSTEVRELLEELRFEIAELRGRMESMQSSLDALTSDSD